MADPVVAFTVCIENDTCSVALNPLRCGRVNSSGDRFTFPQRCRAHSLSRDFAERLVNCAANHANSLDEIAISFQEFGTILAGCVRAFPELQGVMKTLMRNSKPRRSENPRCATRAKSA